MYVHMYVHFIIAKNNASGKNDLSNYNIPTTSPNPNNRQP